MFKNKLDFMIKKEDFIAIFALIFSIIYIMIFDLKEILENSTLENTQLIALFCGAIFSLKAKKNKVFFNFIAMIFFLMLLREISYGRVFINPEQFNFNKTIAHIFVGIYISLAILYALIKKIWIDIGNIWETVKIPFWTFFVSFGCVFIQVLSEKYIHNSCIEETMELMLYCAMISLVLIYQKRAKIKKSSCLSTRA